MERLRKFVLESTETTSGPIRLCDGLPPPVVPASLAARRCRLGRVIACLGMFFAGLFVLMKPARATWYSENVENGADIIMMDLRWPWWPSGTYFANWNSSFNPKPNNLALYAGFTAFLADGPDAMPNPDEALQASFRPGSVWTFWGSNEQGTPVRFTDVAPNLFIKNTYGGEGSSGTTGAEVWPFVQNRRWYTMLARVWKPEEGADHGFMGRWIKDHADGKWHLIGIARLPLAVTSFTGNSGFIEPLTSEKAVRSLHRRFGYYRKDGRWLKSDTIAIDKTEFVVVNVLPEENHEYVAIEYAQRPDLLPRQLSGRPLARDQKHHFTVKQPDAPVLDKPAVTNVRAETTGRQTVVTWEVPETSSPAFAYKIELFDNPECQGTAKVVREIRGPSLRHVLLEAEIPNPTVRFTLLDIFDQETAPVIVPAVTAMAPVNAVVAADSVPGFTYELYHQDAKRQVNYFNPPEQKPDEQHHWLHLEELSQGKLFLKGLSRGFDLGVTGHRDFGYALVFRGLLRVPADGLYIFRAQIDGAYRFQMGGKDVLVWDGQHGTTEKAAVQHLGAGDHELIVTYLYDRLATRNFSIDWEGPQFSRQPVPLEALRLTGRDAYPNPVVKGEALGDGSARVSVSVDARGRKIDHIALFLGSLQLAAGEKDSISYDGPLPAGANTLWARVRYDGNHTVDSDPLELKITGKPVDPAWSVHNVGDAQASAGLWQTAPDSFRFFGNGMHTVTKKVTGDFTATCRIDRYNGSQGEPVNRRAWVGLTARAHGDKRNWEWGTDFHLVQTAADGLRSSADFTDFGGGRISSYELPKNHPWLRMVRQGDIWTAWSSADGKQWDLGAYQYRKAPAEMEAGLFISALPQEARAHYHASISALSIEPGVAVGVTVPQPVMAKNTDGDRITGVVIARSDPQVVVVRSTSLGLIRSSDGGVSGHPANGDLSGEALAVRSVAIHPQDPLTMLRAGGVGTGSGLWKTGDGGKSWTKLEFPGDFDAVGPSALCGEVLAFDLRDPNILYAGSESMGFFKSADGGATWVGMGLAGERITSVVVWPWESHYPAAAKGKSHLCVTTCPDQWMPLLGRGASSVKTTATTSRGYVSHDGVATLAVADERVDTGFFNAAFDKALQSTGEMRYATTHGMQTQVFAGSHMALYPPPKNMEWFRPFTAVGATAMGEQKFGRFMAQALDPEVKGRISRSEVWAFEWSWLAFQGDVPRGGLVSVAGDVMNGEVWWFLHTDGLYVSRDGGTNVTKVLDETGAALPR